MTEAHDAPGQLEAEILADSGLGRTQMRAKNGTKLDGARRPLRVPLLDPDVDAGEDNRGRYLRLTFALAPGAYATNVTREIMGSQGRSRPGNGTPPADSREW